MPKPTPDPTHDLTAVLARVAALEQTVVILQAEHVTIATALKEIRATLDLRPARS